MKQRRYKLWRPVAWMSLCVPFLAAADLTWPNRDFSTWTDAEARSFLTASPWAKLTTPSLLPGLSSWQRRDGGNMEAEGGGKSSGIELSDLTGMHPKDRLAEKTDLAHNGIPKKILIRWESASPVRFAEIKAKDEEGPDIDGEDYAIAVYNVPLKGAFYNVDAKTLQTTLKQNTSLKSEGRKDLRPSRVVLRQDGSNIATIVFFFPRAAHFTTEDKELTFVSLIGRLYLAQYFYPPEMSFLGKLEM
jgi:hypothetical protein